MHSAYRIGGLTYHWEVPFPTEAHNVAESHCRVERGVSIQHLMTVRNLLTALVLTTLVGCGGVSSSAACKQGYPEPCNDEGQGQRAPVSNGLLGLECDGGSESATADFFPHAPQNQFAESVGEPSAELAALKLLSFGRAFDPNSYVVDTSQAGRVTYSDAQGAVVADVVVLSTSTDGFVATEMQVCKSALNAS